MLSLYMLLCPAKRLKTSVSIRGDTAIFVTASQFFTSYLVYLDSVVISCIWFLARQMRQCVCMRARAHLSSAFNVFLKKTFM